MDPSSRTPWQEEINGIFGNTLFPVAKVEVLDNSSSPGLNRATSVITKQRLTFIIERRNRNDIHLQVFDPQEDLQCTYPSCDTTKRHCFTRWINHSLDGNKTKRFLCPLHVKRMDTHLQEVCKTNGVSITSRHIYTREELMSLSGLAHNASCQKQVLYSITSDHDKTTLIQDLFINLRNYLIIVHSSIDLDGEELSVLLSDIMNIVCTIAKTMDMNEQPITKLVYIVREIIEQSLFFYGIMCCWESLHLDTKGQAYNQIGTGIGGLAGVVSTIATGNAMFGLASMMILSRCGGAIRNSWYREIHRKEMMKESVFQYQNFRELHGQKDGVHTWRLYVVVLLIAIIVVQIYLVMK